MAIICLSSRRALSIRSCILTSRSGESAGSAAAGEPAWGSIIARVIAVSLARRAGPGNGDVDDAQHEMHLLPRWARGWDRLIQEEPPLTTPTAATPAAAPSFARGFDNLHREHGFEPLRVEGALPRDLEGTLYRNGVGLMERFGERYAHWFDADGAVSAVRLKGGKALGAARIVATRGLAWERRAGRRLYGGYNTPMVRPIQELFLGDSKSPANTSVLAWQRRLFATCEGGLPVEMSPDELTTFGETSFGDELLRAVSAHPHDVPARRAIYGYGLRYGTSTIVDMLELPYAGRARRLGSFSVKGTRMLHDF